MLFTRLFNARSIDRNDIHTGMTYTECAYIIPLSFAIWRDEPENALKISSGLTEYIDKAFRDLGEIGVLVNDRSPDISSMLAASSLGCLSSCAGRIRLISEEYLDPKSRVQSILQRLIVG